MRYIDKSKPCEPFSEYVAKSKPTAWDTSSKGKRKRLAIHLHQEQSGLCAYCLEQLPLPQGANDTEAELFFQLKRLKTLLLLHLLLKLDFL